MAKAIVSFSGGLDSTTVIAAALDASMEVELVSFSYGSKHNPYENEAAYYVAKHYGLPITVLSLETLMEGFESNLMKTGGPIPEGKYKPETLKKTTVPARNMIFASILSGRAWNNGAEEVWMGIHSGNDMYSDCKPNFFYAMRRAVETGTDGNVSLTAPFLMGTKTTIIKWGIERNVPYHLTRTCYKDQDIACGKCGACIDRLEAFQRNELEDPIEYKFRSL
tara:strand:- start:1730 stop:2395 length:666 start_codon:yes stop_codon:yes gene_type:complete